MKTELQANYRFGTILLAPMNLIIQSLHSRTSSKIVAAQIIVRPLQPLEMMLTYRLMGSLEYLAKKNGTNYIEKNDKSVHKISFSFMFPVGQ